MELALAEPDLVDRLVLVSPGLPGWDWSPQLRADWEAEEAAWQRRDLDDVAWRNVRIWVDGPQRGGEAAPEVRQAVFDMYRHALELQAVDGAMDSGAVEPTSSGRLGEISARTLVLVGELDQPDMLAFGEYLGQEIPGAAFEVLPEVAHLPPMEDPESFVAVVREFLEG